MVRKQERFSIRKYAVGAASVLVGLGLVYSGGQVAADTVTSEAPKEDTAVVAEEKPAGEVSEVASNVAEEGLASEKPVADTVLVEESKPEGQELPVSPSEETAEVQDQPVIAVRAAEEDPETAAARERLELRKIISIDAGRKYFSPDQIKEIIDTAHEKGFTDLHLLLGNDGMRFFLDDMTVTTAEKTYDSDAVKAALAKGNDQYYKDPNGNHLTETDMNAILDYAKSKNIGLLPAINSPGHMDAILNGMEHLGIENPKFVYRGKTSERTLDLNNTAAVNFSKTLVEKYAKYFNGKTDIFNIGLDEYANDAVPNVQGFNVLRRNGGYAKFITYANDLAKIVKDNKMSPMAFNDGIYHDHDTSHGTFDKDLIISMWTGGWGGYNVASSKFLADKGHKILNTNDAWYYVLGRDYAGSGWYNLDQGLDGIGKTTIDSVPKSDGASIASIGSMIAVWADNPRATFKLANVARMMDKFVEKNPTYFRADYSKLIAEAEKLPEDLSGYSLDSVEALIAAYDTVNLYLDKSQQAKVDGYLATLVKARESLVMLDKKPLQDEVAMKTSLMADARYMNASADKKAAYDRALAGAEAILKKERLSQSELDAAKMALMAATKDLDGKAVMTSVGEPLIQDAKPDSPIEMVGEPLVQDAKPDSPIEMVGEPLMEDAKPDSPIEMVGEPLVKDAKPDSPIEMVSPKDLIHDKPVYDMTQLKMDKAADDKKEMGTKTEMKEEKKAALPETGEGSSSLLTSLALTTLLGAGLLLATKTRKENG